MKKKGLTIMEFLIVIGVIGILVLIGGLSIKKQAESRGMLIVENEIGDFFRVAAKRSLETGKKYGVDFDLVDKDIEIYREENTDGEWEDDGTRTTIETLELPTVFEYSIKPSLTDGKTTLTSTGNINDNFTLYISNSKEIEYAINFDKDDFYVKYLHIREYFPTDSVPISAMTATPSAISGLELIRD